jgi:hypothetical protein
MGASRRAQREHGLAGSTRETCTTEFGESDLDEIGFKKSGVQGIQTLERFELGKSFGGNVNPVNESAPAEPPIEVALLESSFKMIAPRAEEFVDSFYTSLFEL